MARRLVVLTTLVLTLSGCGGAPDRAVLTSATVQPVPDAGEDARLRIDGRVDRSLRLGDDTLRSRARQSVRIYEPFEKRELGFRVMPVRDLLRLAGVQADAKTLHAVALNDYVVDIPLDVAAADGVYLAVSDADGSAIPVESGGPIRIVFAEDAEGADVENYWIWSLESVTLK